MALNCSPVLESVLSWSRQLSSISSNLQYDECVTVEATLPFGASVVKGVIPKLRVDERESFRVCEKDGLSCSDKGIEIDSNVSCCERSLARVM